MRGHPWRPALSTTGTFGGRISAVLEDRRLMLAALWTGADYDHTTCLMLHGFEPFAWTDLIAGIPAERGAMRRLRRTGVSALRLALCAYQRARRWAGRPRRVMVAPDPALITHLESAELALGTDWDALAGETLRWAEAIGATCETSTEPVAP